jgi:hypothetical protein
MSADSAANGGERVLVAVDAESIELIERRRHERLSTRLRARWEDSLGCYEGTVSDISLGGCFILSDRSLPPGELIRLEIELHSGALVKVWGEVSNHFPSVGFGVRYTEIADEAAPGNYTRAIVHTKALESAVAALKRLDASVVRRDGNISASILVNHAEYKSRLMLTLPVVNKSMLSLPECRKKTALRLSMQAFVDASKAWSTISKRVQADSKILSDMMMLLQGRYDAPPELVDALRQGDHLTVLNFLWLKSYIYLTFAV